MRRFIEISGYVLGELLDLAGVAFCMLIIAAVCGFASQEVQWLRLISQ